MFAGFKVRMEDTRLPKGVMFRELVGGAECMRGAGKRVDVMFPGRPRSFRYQRRLVDDCSPGRGEWRKTAEQGAERYGEMDHCRESQGWTTVCSINSSSMTESDGKDQG